MAENEARKRIWDDDSFGEGATVSEADDVAHSPEALQILQQQGEQAWRAYVEQRRGTATGQ